MLKVRLMGTPNDIRWFEKLMDRHKKVKVIRVSEKFENKGTNRFYRKSRNVICRYERTGRVPRGMQLNMIAKALDVSVRMISEYELNSNYKIEKEKEYMLER